MPTGRAIEMLPRDEFYNNANGISGSCVDSLALLINSYGEVFPCCAGFDTCRNCNFGNINESSIVEIINDMNMDPMLRQLVFLGPKSYYKILKDGGCKIPEDDKFTNFCHFCNFIFSNDEMVNVIREHFDQLRQDSIKKAIAVLEKKLSARISEYE
jgi:hypothetical protein